MQKVRLFYWVCFSGIFFIINFVLLFISIHKSEEQLFLLFFSNYKESTDSTDMVSAEFLGKYIISQKTFQQFKILFLSIAKKTYPK